MKTGILHQLQRTYTYVLRRMYRIALLRPVVVLLYKFSVSPKTLNDSIQSAEERIMALSPRPNGSSTCRSRHTEQSEYDLSVIIPFYKSEKYAVECIESVLSQNSTYKVQIIMVNDGSPDNCRAILDEYADYDDVIVEHRENRGAAAARNAGVELARGEYLMFIDSDDWLAQNAIQNLMDIARAENADIVEGSHQIVSCEGKHESSCIHKLERVPHGEGMFGYPWGKVIRKTLFSDVCFPEGFWYEDSILVNLIHPAGQVTITVPDIVIFYRKNPKGATAAGVGSPKAIDTLYVMEDILNTYLTLELPFTEQRKRTLLKQFGPYLINRICWMDEANIKAAFLVASELVHRFPLELKEKTGDFFFDEYYEALLNRRYHRWKWAALLS